MDYNFKFSINVDDRIIGFFKRLFVRKNILMMLAAVIAGSTIFVFAAQITKQYTFTSGTTISSAQVNANFDDLFTQVNANALENIIFPDGIPATATSIKTSVFMPVTFYTVPTGKRLYITRLRNLDGISQTNVIFAGNTYYQLYNNESIVFTPPLVFNEGQLSTTSNTGYEITGFLINTNTTTTVINTIVNLSTPYTVPSLKKLYLYTAHGAVLSVFKINGIEFFNLTAGTTMSFNKYPLILTEGTVISTDQIVNITGVLK